MNNHEPRRYDRRSFLKLGLTTGSAALWARYGLAPHPALAAPGGGKGPKGGSDDSEPMPTSPFILNPFTEELPIPRPYAASNPGDWTDPLGNYLPPSPEPGQPLFGNPAAWAYYRIPLLLRPHDFTSSAVLPIDANGSPVGAASSLPSSMISGFNGTFPGPLIKAFYGQPCLVRFENLLPPVDSSWGDFGVPSHLTHLHNAHTAAESDGNPSHRPIGYDSWYLDPNPSRAAYVEQRWFEDNLYGNFCPDDDVREAQSFFWFHDHRMDNTSSNVYKGMVGLYYLYGYDDTGDETQGHHLPGVPQADGSVLYDIPLALYDVSLDDGVTDHKGHNGESSISYGVVQDGAAHPENWGKAFFAHYTNHGFVGDIFTVNGKAFPVLRVKRRKYRLRFLDCSITRWYELALMTGTPKPKPGVQGQWLLDQPQQCMQFTMVATDGGLLPRAIRDLNSFQIAPAKRREVIVDFTKYMDGNTWTRPGDEFYLVNTLLMTDGRKPESKQDRRYVVPIMKIVIDPDDPEPPAPDFSEIPNELHPAPPVPQNLTGVTTRTFRFERSNSMWMINGEPFDPLRSLAAPVRDSEEVWVFQNGGGGWVHPIHIHQEEHRVISRNGGAPPPSDSGKEDVVALDENEEVVFYRKFRTFTGKYVCHCHNLIHEDHAMMFTWTIVP